MEGRRGLSCQVREGKLEKRAWWVQVESASRESMLFFFRYI
jgi:hypothetical protein